MVATASATGRVTGIAVYPGRPASVHLAELPMPIPGPGEVLVRVRRVGVCGTDKEIIDAKFGTPPPGSDELVLGHEVLGVVEDAGDAVAGFNPGDLVVSTVRRPDGCPACRAGQPDMCLWRGYTERGIIGAHGFMIERFVEEPAHLVKIPVALEPVAVMLEPLSVVEKAWRQARQIQRRIAGWQPRTALILGAGPIGLLGTLLLRAEGMEVVTVARTAAPNPAAVIVTASGGRYVSTRETPLPELAAELPNIDLIFECTGVSEPAFQATSLLGGNGVLVLLSLTGGHERLVIPAAEINREFVLGNKVMVGSVNSAREDFVAGVGHFDQFEELWPRLTQRLITHRLRGFAEFARIREASSGGIKAVIEL
ncbi:MAG: glucose 1-dehydrogenase [Thermomicrobiales bacterium]